MPVIYVPTPTPQVVENADLRVEVDQARLRIGVTIKAWPVDEPVTIYRVHPDGSQWPVRGAEPFTVSSGQGFVWDYEAPINVDLAYRVVGASGDASIASVAMPCDDVLLRAPGLPSLDLHVDLLGKPAQLDRGRPHSVRYPMGSDTPIVRSGTRRKPVFALPVKVRSDADAAALEALLDQAPVLLLQVPGTRLGWQYVHVADDTETPVVHFADVDRDGEGIGTWSDYMLTCTVVDRPVGGMFGDPTASWQAYVDAGITWQQLVDGGYTWLDMLRGTPLGQG